MSIRPMDMQLNLHQTKDRNDELNQNNQKMQLNQIAGSSEFHYKMDRIREKVVESSETTYKKIDDESKDGFNDRQKDGKKKGKNLSSKGTENELTDFQQHKGRKIDIRI